MTATSIQCFTPQIAQNKVGSDDVTYSISVDNAAGVSGSIRVHPDPSFAEDGSALETMEYTPESNTAIQITVSTACENKRTYYYYVSINKHA